MSHKDSKYRQAKFGVHQDEIMSDSKTDSAGKTANWKDPDFDHDDLRGEDGLLFTAEDRKRAGWTK